MNSASQSPPEPSWLLEMLRTPEGVRELFGTPMLDRRPQHAGELRPNAAASRGQPKRGPLTKWEHALLIAERRTIP